MRRLAPSRPAPTGSVRGIVDPAAALGAFRLVRLAPAPDLADVVERHWIVRWNLPPGVEHTQTIVPHPNANIVAEPGVFAAYGIPPVLFHRTLAGRGAVVGTKLDHIACAMSAVIGQSQVGAAASAGTSGRVRPPMCSLA